ncbi:MAG: UDP-N-acetylmuramate dehydrogenase [Cellvibrionaceae bacterium]|jgi:UDP-N-acetylmuramate dehydrogenase
MPVTVCYYEFGKIMISENHANSDGVATIQQEINLQSLNTLRVPSLARWFCRIETEADIEAAIRFAGVRRCPKLILGSGSNLLLPERFDGLAIHVGLRGRDVLEEDNTSVCVALAAGEGWHESVLWSIDQGYSGLENLALIPGSVGAAPVQNIGAYGVELDSVFESLEAIDLHSGKRHRMSKADCRFSYRDSIFKSDRGNDLLITRVLLRLHKQPQSVLSYPALIDYLAERNMKSPSPRQVAAAVAEIRRRKLPDPASIPNAGSFFKNPIVSARLHQNLLNSEADLVSFPQADGRFKIAAGWLLERAGWKALNKNGIGVHDRQALILINPQAQPARVLLEFADEIRASIRQRFGVELEIEPRVIE